MLPSTAADLCELASSRIGALLVCAHKQDVWIVIEDVMCAIAMMDIIVKDHDLQYIR